MSQKVVDDVRVESKGQLDWANYAAMYQQSVEDPSSFWAEKGEEYTWFKKWDEVKDTSFENDVDIKWYKGGQLNITVNCLDRHLESRGDKTAFIWEPDDPAETPIHYTYRELYHKVCEFANALRSQGVKKGDRVTLYMPMIPEAGIAMLACARIGAVHSVVFGGFSPDSLRNRVLDCESDVIITADMGRRGGRNVHLKDNVDAAVNDLDSVRKVIVVQRTADRIDWYEGRDVWWHDIVEGQPNECEPEVMDAESPLFILYTSGSTGKPKGLLHTTAGYMVWAATTHKYVFDLKEDDVYWCTADVGWITGHSYILYGPLANGSTTLLFEGVPNFPDASRCWEVVDRHKVSIFYTAPTAIRALMKVGDNYVNKTSRKSLRVLGTVGEPINPEAWRWFHEVVGDKRCPIVDTWWQTETGGHMITPIPGAWDLKPGSATLPFFGVQPVITTPEGVELEGEAEGLLSIKDSWPGQARSIYGDHQRYKETYFSTVPGYYFTGDGARSDKDGYYWITGRVDDVLNVSGHRLGTAEIESALVLHSSVSEAAVVGYPHDVKGQGIYCYVTLQDGASVDDHLEKELIKWVRSEIGPIATPDVIHFTDALPKTRSGKIMRRILRKIAENDYGSLGDTSTLLNPEVVDSLIETRKTKETG